MLSMIIRAIFIQFSHINFLSKDNNSNKNPVVMLYNLSKEMNANRVFNMLCLYGNVFKVRHLNEFM